MEIPLIMEYLMILKNTLDCIERQYIFHSFRFYRVNLEIVPFIEFQDI